MTIVDLTRTTIEVTHAPAGTDAGPAFARPFAVMSVAAQVEAILDRAYADADRLRAVEGNATTARLCGVVADDRVSYGQQQAALVVAYRALDELQRKLFGGARVRIEMRPGGGS